MNSLIVRTVIITPPVLLAQRYCSVPIGEGIHVLILCHLCTAWFPKALFLLRTLFINKVRSNPTQSFPSSSFPISPVLPSHSCAVSFLFGFVLDPESIECCQYVHGHRSTRWSGQHRSRTPLKGADYPHPGSHHQVPAAPRLGVVFPTTSPSMTGAFWLHPAQVLCMSSQALSVHMCNSPVCLGNSFSTVPGLWLSEPLSLSFSES